MRAGKWLLFNLCSVLSYASRVWELQCRTLFANRKPQILVGKAISVLNAVLTAKSASPNTTNTRKQTPGNKHPETNDRSWAIRRESVSPASPQCSLTVASLLDYMTACFWARMTIPSTGFLPSVLRHSISLQWSLNPESRRHVSMYCLSWLYRP